MAECYECGAEATHRIVGTSGDEGLRCPTDAAYEERWGVVVRPVES